MKEYIFKRHRDDEWFDEVRLKGSKGPLLRIVTIPRYKTSSLSGDEWRASAQPQLWGGRQFEPFDRHFLNLEVAAQALYPGLYDHRNLHDLSVAHIDFLRKGRLEYRSTYDGKSLRLLDAAGHLPWALIQAGEAVVANYDWERFCFQPGCSALAVSVYQIKKTFSRSGDEIIDGGSWSYRRAFCRRHLRRGNASREDCDDNYIVVRGPGPEEAEGFEGDVSEASFGGLVDLRDLDLGL